MQIYNGSEPLTGAYVKITMSWQHCRGTALGSSFPIFRNIFLFSAHSIILTKKVTGFAERSSVYAKPYGVQYNKILT
jgi:hypothetical protein